MGTAKTGPTASISADSGVFERNKEWKNLPLFSGVRPQAAQEGLGGIASGSKTVVEMKALPAGGKCVGWPDPRHCVFGNVPPP